MPALPSICSQAGVGDDTLVDYNSGGQTNNKELWRRREGARIQIWSGEQEKGPGRLGFPRIYVLFLLLLSVYLLR